MKILTTALILTLFLCGCDQLEPPLFYRPMNKKWVKPPVYAKDVFSSRKGDKLAKAIIGGRHSTMGKLLEKDEALANEAGIYGINPLWIAVLKQDEKAVRILLENGGDPNPSVTYVEPVMINAAQGKSGILKVLLDNGGRSDTKYRGKPCLYFAQDSYENMDLLVDNGADINQIDSHGKTTIMTLAMVAIDIDAIIYLLEKGADPSIRDAKGRTMVDFMDMNSERFGDRFAPVYQWLEDQGYDLDELRNPKK